MNTYLFSPILPSFPLFLWCRFLDPFRRQRKGKFSWVVRGPLLFRCHLFRGAWPCRDAAGRCLGCRREETAGLYCFRLKERRQNLLYLSVSEKKQKKILYKEFELFFEYGYFIQSFNFICRHRRMLELISGTYPPRAMDEPGRDDMERTGRAPKLVTAGRNNLNQ